MRLKNKMAKQKLLAARTDLEATRPDTQLDDDDFYSVGKSTSDGAGEKEARNSSRKFCRFLVVSISLVLWLCLSYCAVSTCIAYFKPDAQSIEEATVTERINSHQMVMSIEVVDTVGESGQTITQVTVVKGSFNVSPALALGLVAAAAIYLVLMLVQICRKKKRRGIDGSESQSTQDENYESVSDYTETETYDDFETSASNSLADDRKSYRKDTMSNTSIDYPSPQHQSLRARGFFESGNRPQHGHETERNQHVRHISKLIFNQSIQESDEAKSYDGPSEPSKPALVIDTNLPGSPYNCMDGQVWLAENLHQSTRMTSTATHQSLAANQLRLEENRLASRNSFNFSRGVPTELIALQEVGTPSSRAEQGRT